MNFVRINRVLLPCLSLFVSAGVGACSSTDAAPWQFSIPMEYSENVTPKGAENVAHYGAIDDDKFPIAAVDVSRLAERNLRQSVNFATHEHPGTIVIDTENRFLYLVQEHGKAIRYGIGVGVDGLEFKGSAIVGYKREWPRWTPTENMIRRNPDLYANLRGGMEGGPSNPLGARALYLFKDGKDTLFRIHGTSEPRTIGRAISSGCIRMLNHDVIDLHRRTPSGSRVVVLEGAVKMASQS